MDLHIKFDGEEIIVTKPGTDFMLAYRKRPDSPTLKLTEAGSIPTLPPPVNDQPPASGFLVILSAAHAAQPSLRPKA